MVICCFTSLSEFTTLASETKMWNSAPLWSHCRSLWRDHQRSPQSEPNRGDKAGLCSVGLVAVQKAAVSGRKSGRTLWGERWPFSGGAPEECRPLSLYCDGDCRDAASGRRPSASSQSCFGFRTLSCCRRHGVQVGRTPGGMLRASGWDPPPRHLTCWVEAVSVPLSTLQRMNKSCCPAQIEYVAIACDWGMKKLNCLII